MGFDHCCEILSVSKVKVAEKGKKVVLLNPTGKKIAKWRVDGCMRANETACDWLLVHDETNYVFVELKGCDVGHAIDQVSESIAWFIQSRRGQRRIAALIVCRNPPAHPAFTSKLQRARENLKSKFHAPLHVIQSGRELSTEQIHSFVLRA